MESKGRKIAYFAISQYGDIYDNQIQHIEFDIVFVDKTSLKDYRRPELDSMLNGTVKKGDHVFVPELSVIAKSMVDLMKIVEKILKLDAEIHFMKENLHFRNEIEDGKTQKNKYEMLTIFAQFEADLIKKRQREGIEAARAAGKHLGRPRKINMAQRTEILEQYKLGKNPTQIAKLYGISRGSVYKIITVVKKTNESVDQRDIVNVNNNEKQHDKEQVSDNSRIPVNRGVARRLAREMTEKYEKKYNPVFEELIAAILHQRHESYELIKDQVEQYTGYSKYKSGYFMSKIIPKLNAAGLISITGTKDKKIAWK